jgi:hypothetical protein
VEASVAVIPDVFVALQLTSVYLDMAHSAGLGELARRRPLTIWQAG